MQAKKVFEAQHFERGHNPKASMGIGGIVLKSQKEKYLQDMKEAQRDAEIFNNQEWEMYLQKTLIGKKITAKMTSMPTMNTKTKEMHGKRETKNFTITVADVVTSDLSELLLNIVVADENDKMYGLSLNDKIYFE